MSLKLYLQELSEQIKAETKLIRATFNNNTNKGNGFETVIRNLISTYLPSMYNVTQGETIDTFDTHSGQTDLLIVQDFHWRGHSDGRPNLIFYDLLTGIGEMKTSLTTDQLQTTIANSNLLNKFQRHQDNNNLLSGDFYDLDKSHQKPPPFFLTALTSNIALDTLATEIKTSLISMIVVLEHSTENNGLIILGDTHGNQEVVDTLNIFGTQVRPNIWTSDNPILGLIWGLNKFQVPFINLTNMTTYYFK
jgi:hypothetical protein